MRRFACGAALAAVLVLGIQVGALAQKQPTPTPTPTPTPVPAPDLPDPNARQGGLDNSAFRRELTARSIRNDPVLRHAFLTPQGIAECFVKNANRTAGEYLGGEMTADPAFQRLSGAFASKYKRCVSTESVNIPMIVLDGAIAELLLRSEKRALPDRSEAADVAGAKAFYTSPGGVSMTSAGRCLVAYSPGVAGKVLATAPDSAAERAAMQALYQSSPECRIDMPADIPVTEQRAAIASGLYHWLHRA